MLIRIAHARLGNGLVDIRRHNQRDYYCDSSRAESYPWVLLAYKEQNSQYYASPNDECSRLRKQQDG